MNLHKALAVLALILAVLSLFVTGPFLMTAVMLLAAIHLV